MYAANGVGIAAPQLGMDLQLFVRNPIRPSRCAQEVW